MDLKASGYWGIDWINLVQDGCQQQDLLNAMLSLRVLKDVNNILKSWVVV
jgi:hypothetical protein